MQKNQKKPQKTLKKDSYASKVFFLFIFIHKTSVFHLEATRKIVIYDMISLLVIALIASST